MASGTKKIEANGENKNEGTLIGTNLRAIVSAGKVLLVFDPNIVSGRFRKGAGNPRIASTGKFVQLSNGCKVMMHAYREDEAAQKAAGPIIGEPAVSTE